MEFIKRILHVNFRYEEQISFDLPNYITSRYSIRIAWIDKIKVFLIYPKTELEQVNTLKKHFSKIQTIEKLPLILITDRITARQRQKLIDAEISFIVDNKQCYLPFIGTLLTERCDAEISSCDKLVPSAQMLLLFYILKEKKDMPATEAVNSLNFSAMTITRAVRQLEETGLICTYKRGVSKVITSECSSKELFEKAKPYLINPVKTVKYIERDKIKSLTQLAGDSALSEKSMLNPPGTEVYAVFDETIIKNYSSDELFDDTRQVKIQVWKYNPSLLSSEKEVDVLSLALSYMDNTDERTEEAVEEMLNNYWEEHNGKRIG